MLGPLGDDTARRRFIGGGRVAFHTGIPPSKQSRLGKTNNVQRLLLGRLLVSHS